MAIDGGNVKPVQQLCHARRPDGNPIIDFSLLKKITAKVGRLDSMTELFEMWSLRNLQKIKLSSMSLPLPHSYYLFIHIDDVYFLYYIVNREVCPHPSESTSSLKGLFTMLKPSLPTLVDIDIEYYIDEDDDEDDEDDEEDKTDDDSPLAGLCTELEKMIGQNVVETIKLLIWVHQPSSYDYTRWSELDDILMGSSSSTITTTEGWPALREVSLSFNVTTTSKKDSGKLKALRKLPMKKLAESKRVEFDFQVNEFQLY